MLQKLRKLLAECHIAKNDPILQALKDTDYGYLLSRTEEELVRIRCNPRMDGYNQDSETRLKLCIQLLNLARMKLRESIQSQSNSG